MTSAEYALVSMDLYREAEDVGEFCELPHTAKTETEQRNAGRKLTAKHELHNTFQNIVTVLTIISEEVIDPVYHSGRIGMADEGFGLLIPPIILPHLQQLYGKPSISLINSNWLQLNASIDRNQPIEVMMCHIEEVQMFLLANPEEGQQFTEIQLITNALIKLSVAGGMYAKPLEKWLQRDASTRSN